MPHANIFTVLGVRDEGGHSLRVKEVDVESGTSEIEPEVVGVLEQSNVIDDHRGGDAIEVNAPGGARGYEILKVRWG